MSTLTVITGPTTEPITIDEAKSAIRIDHDDDDLLIEGYITSARIFAEAFLSRYLMTQTLERSWDNWPGSVIDLDIWPLQSIDSVKYLDTASPVAEQTLVVNADYYADIIMIGGRVVGIYSWPATADQPNAVKIRVTAGYASASEIPQQIKDGIKAYVAFLYDGDPSLETVAKSMLWPHRIL